MHPLTVLTSPMVKFKWGDVHEEGFRTVERALNTEPALAHPDFDRDFIVHIDASKVALGAVLSQRELNRTETPVAFASSSLTEAERNYNTCEREALAVVYALKKFRLYVLGPRFTLYTDHNSLRAAFSGRDVHGRLAR